MDTMNLLIQTKLHGMTHLQNKIFYYYFSQGTPACNQMKPLIKELELYKKRHTDKDPDLMTAWIYLFKNKHAGEHYNFNDHFNINAMFTRTLPQVELNIVRIKNEWSEWYVPSLFKYCDWCLTGKKEKALNRFIKQYYSQEHGTPSAKCIRDIIFQCKLLTNTSIQQILKNDSKKTYKLYL